MADKPEFQPPPAEAHPAVLHIRMKAVERAVKRMPIRICDEMEKRMTGRFQTKEECVGRHLPPAKPAAESEKKSETPGESRFTIENVSKGVAGLGLGIFLLWQIFHAAPTFPPGSTPSIVQPHETGAKP